MKIGSRGDHIAALQRMLNETGVSEQLVTDGIFGPKTEAAVKTVQEHLGLLPTGEADHGLMAALRVTDIIPHKLSGADLHEVAFRLKVDYPAIAAIVAVESRGEPFLTGSGRPVILFERHIMRRRLKLRGLPVEGHPENIVNTRPGGYRGGEREWERFEKAAAIHWDSAVESCSWGLMQIMGFHWERLGYMGPRSWFDLMHRSTGDQVEAFVRFMQADPVLLQALREHRWQTVAHRYNGPNYKINRYDERLRAEYESAARYA
jgi:hypothetical protein